MSREPASRPARSGGEEGPPAGEERPVDAAAAADALLGWYRGRERDVPGRGESDPYRIWVAEVMAQQTRISTVRDYYRDFLERFPNVGTLADADQQEVLKAWEGLGYYARARRLHRAAREVMERYGGELPRTADRLRELPGVGPYTAGAVASMAFGEAEPAVDGNVRRVLARLFDLAEPTPARLEAAARKLLDARPDEPAELNQALMDLGGGICTPRDPSCATCPAAGSCLARERGTVAERPPAAPRREIPHRRVAVGVVWDPRGRVLVQRRPPDGLLGGLWEFPGGKVEDGESPREAVCRELREEVAVEVEVTGTLEPVNHAYSHFRVTLHPFHARVLAGEPEARSATDWRWMEPGRLDELPFPAANHRILEQIRGEGRSAG